MLKKLIEQKKKYESKFNKEIVDFLHENLFEDMEESLNTPKDFTEEEFREILLAAGFVEYTEENFKFLKSREFFDEWVKDILNTEIHPYIFWFKGYDAVEICNLQSDLLDTHKVFFNSSLYR